MLLERLRKRTPLRKLRQPSVRKRHNFGRRCSLRCLLAAEAEVHRSKLVCWRRRCRGILGLATMLLIIRGRDIARLGRQVRVAFSIKRPFFCVVNGHRGSCLAPAHSEARSQRS